MTSAEATALIRRAIREPKPVKVSDDAITDVIGFAVDFLGEKIKQHAPDSLKSRKSITSTTHIFDYPSDCETLMDVWDLGTNAGTITGATNATPIVITEEAHGRSTDNIVTIHNVLGNLVANDTWEITKVDADSYSLDGSVATADYVSGGKVFEESTDFLPMTRIPESESTLNDDSKYFLRNGKIIVDDVAFANDLLVTYIHSISSISDIPTKHQLGVVAFGVMQLMDLPATDNPLYWPKKATLDWNAQVWKGVIENILRGSQISTKALGVSKGKHI